MKIAVWYNLPSGGARRALHSHIKGLVERGHTAEAWRPPIPSKGFAPISELIEEQELPLEILAEGGSYVDKILRHIRRPWLLMESMKQHSAACTAQMEGKGFDLLFGNTCMHFHAPFVGRTFAGPKLLYLQEPRRPFYEPMPRMPWLAPEEADIAGLSVRSLKRRWRDKVDLQAARVQAREERHNAAAFDKILVNSFFSRESVLKAYGLSAQVCYLGIDTTMFEDRGLERERFVIGLGTIGPTKNVRLAIEAIGAMPDPKPALVWVGNMTDGPYADEMVALAARLGVNYEPKVMVTDAELVDLLNRASLMVYSPRLEPFGYAPLEANACGCPVVAVAEGGVRETILDGVNGRLVDHDPEIMGEAIREMLEDRKGAHEMGQEAKRLVHEKWRVSDAVDRLEHRLRQVAGR